MITNREKYLIGLFLVFSVFAGFVWQDYHNLNLRFEKLEIQKQEYLSRSSQALEHLSLEAKALAVYDFTLNQEIYNKNGDVPMPLASLTKILSIPLGLKFDDSPVYISKEAIRMPGDDGLRLGDEWDSLSLGQFALVTSSNDATYAISNRIPFLINHMNHQAKRLGALNTFFLNETGLDIDDTPSAIGSAKDVNLLAYSSLKNNYELFTPTGYLRFVADSKLGSNQGLNTNIVIEELPNVLMSKTGYTNQAGGNLTVIFKNKSGHHIAVTLLGSSFQGRFTDMVKVVKALYDIEYVI